MESKHQTPSVILKLMGLDKVPPQHHPVRDRQKVLSEDYLQKVASIGVRKKRSSNQRHSSGMSSDEKEESDDVLKVVKTIRRDKNHNPSKGNGKENPSLSGTEVEGVPQQLLDASVKWKPRTLVDNISSFNIETSVKAEQGNLLSQQKRNNGLQNVVHREAGLYETFRLSRSQLDLKDETFNSRIAVSNANPGKGGNGSKYFSFPGSRKNSHLADGLLKEIFCPKRMRIYPEMRGSEAKSTTLEQTDVTEKMQEVGQHGHDSTHQQLPMISEHRNGARNLRHQSGFSNDKIKRNIRCKLGVNYSFARKVPMARPLCAASVNADNCGTITKDSLFQKYWGLRKNASNWSTQKSKNQNINHKDCSEDMNLRSSSEKSPFSSYFNSNDTEENCIDLHKLKKRCYGNDSSDKKPMLSQLASSGPSLAFIDSQILQQTCLMDDDVKSNEREDINMSKQSAVSPDSSVDCLVSDAKTEVVGWSHNNPTKQQSESTVSIMTRGGCDSLSHASYASTQQVWFFFIRTVRIVNIFSSSCRTFGLLIFRSSKI